ncbi:hypothetical protein [Chelatococcus sp. XZ-Ab1]|uniref:hypothetical protein n=1 Tax=Chelatococcus sp. XZ-Ab1 TaxID=3034027 RepID=UPI0023E3FDF2|nr:hypothetical protein [Chelatococcus sp. XZ-Ab1]
MKTALKPASQNDLAKHFGLSRARVRALVADGIVPAGADIDTARLTYLDWLRDEDRRSTKAAGESAVRMARARQIELRTARDQRELVPWQEATAYTQEIVGMLISRMQGLPAQVTRDPALRSKIENAIDAIRTDVADAVGQLEAQINDREDGEDANA